MICRSHVPSNWFYFRREKDRFWFGFGKRKSAALMISILSKTALQCPFENILLLRQIQKQSNHLLFHSQSSFDDDDNGNDSQNDGNGNDSFDEEDEIRNRLLLVDASDLIGTLDVDGYLKADPKYAKQHQLPDNFANLSTWSAIIALVWHKHEGIASLWKGIKISVS